MLKRIAVKDVTLGMFICEFCGSWMEHPLGKTHFLLDDEKDLQAIHASATKELWIDNEQGLDVGAFHSATTSYDAPQQTDALPREAERERLTEKTSLDQELQVALTLCAQAKDTVRNLFRDARLGKPLQIVQAQAVVDEISHSVSRHSHALISLARLKRADEYIYLHSVAVCALMIALARQLKLDEAQVREVGLAGLLHDIGKVGIPLMVLDKPGNLTEIEFSVVKSHPEVGARILMDNFQVSPIVLDVCLHHHEKVDGSGYPHGLTGDTLSIFAKMAAVCDVYDAITSNRPYKKGWPPAESIRKMAEWSKGHFDETVFQAFVKTVGIYPIGSLVRLESGRLAVVIEHNAKSLLTPTVMVFFSAITKMPIMQASLNLAELKGTDKIIGRESPSEWGFKNLDKLWSGMSQPRG